MSKARYATVAGAALGTAVGSCITMLYSQSQKEKPAPAKDEKDETPGLVILPKSITGEPNGLMAVQSRKASPEPRPDISDPDGILKYGNPGPVNDELKAISFYGAYDRRNRNPYWVAEHMTPESVSTAIGRRKNNFKEDRSIPAIFRARPKDYTNTGYDRGHQVPANPAKWSQKAIDETFRMTNICPQVGVGFNQHYWKNFEEWCMNLTTRYPSVRVITGPLYLPEKGEDGKWRVTYEVIGDQSGDGKGPPNVSVPTHFYKIVFGEEESDKNRIGSKVAVGAFVLPNKFIEKEDNLQDYETEIDIIERASGLEFAQELKSSQRKRLCQEVKCDIKVKDFSEAIDELTEQASNMKL